MRFFLLFFLVTSCSFSPQWGRHPSSTKEPVSKTQIIDIKKTTIKFFSPRKDREGFHFYLFLNLLDSHGDVVDGNLDEFELKNNQTILKDLEINKIGAGKFYFIFRTKQSEENLLLRVFFKGSLIKEFSPITLSFLDRKKTSLKELYPIEDGIRFRLILVDKNLKKISLGMEPEIFVTDLANYHNLEEVSPGVWEFDVTFPNESQIIYISVRAHGVYLQNFYRLHYIQK